MEQTPFARLVLQAKRNEIEGLLVDFDEALFTLEMCFEDMQDMFG